MQKNNPVLFLKVIVTLFCLGILSEPVEAKASEQNKLKIMPIQQASNLCGTTVAEMILFYAGKSHLGQNGQYVISTQSRGSAVAQYLCDLMADGTVKSDQPQCVNDQGQALAVYQHGRPTVNAGKVYLKGTYLLGLKQLFELEKMPAVYQRSLYSKTTGMFEPRQSQKRFLELMDEVRANKPVIIHVTPHLKPGGGHYLLIYGYDDRSQTLHYIDPNPPKGHSAKAFVAYDHLRNGQGWFRETWFWTGRYLAVESP